MFTRCSPPLAPGVPPIISAKCNERGRGGIAPEPFSPAAPLVVVNGDGTRRGILPVGRPTPRAFTGRPYHSMRQAMAPNKAFSGETGVAGRVSWAN